MENIVVLKFGGSVLRHGEDLPTAVHEIYRWYRSGLRVVAIVSAIGDETETLLVEARSLADDPDSQATAELLATGERRSAALLCIALDRAGLPARVVDPNVIELTAAGSPLDSEPVGVDRDHLEKLLSEFSVIIVPGGFGHDREGQAQRFGRKGSGVSAVYLASALGASRCRLVKALDGVCERDSAQALECPALIQPNAVRCLPRCGTTVEIASVLSSQESLIAPDDQTLFEPHTAPPTSVLLLGLGTVGQGVYRRLLALPQHFRVAGVLVRDCAKHATAGVSCEVLRNSVDTVARLPADVVVDALPGTEPSLTLMRQFLSRGMSVVSCNTHLIATHGAELAMLATRQRASLRYTAAVGGSAPMLEALGREAQRGEILCIAGLLSSTCNYVARSLRGGVVALGGCALRAGAWLRSSRCHGSPLWARCCSHAADPGAPRLRPVVERDHHRTARHDRAPENACCDHRG